MPRMKNGPYEMVKAPDAYPGMKYRGKYVYEHHLVWWTNTGKLVPEGFVIHHVNHEKRDNRIENLELIDRSAHSKDHAKEKLNPPISMECGWCTTYIEVRARRFKLGSVTTKFFCSKSCSMQYQLAHGIGGVFTHHARNLSSVNERDLRCQGRGKDDESDTTKCG